MSRLKELIEKSTTYTWFAGSGTTVTFDKEEFAKMVLQDAIDVLYTKGHWTPEMSEILMDHFGE